MMGDIVDALVEILARLVVGQPRSDDSSVAQSLLKELVVGDFAPIHLALGTVAFHAAFPAATLLERQIVTETLEGARSLLTGVRIGRDVALASCALTLIATAGFSEQDGEDLALAAEGARRVEMHDVALHAANAALASTTSTVESVARALLVIGRVSRSRGDLDAALDFADRLPQEHPVAVDARFLRGTLRPETPDKGPSLSQLLRAGMRREAAINLLGRYGPLRAAEDPDQAIGDLTAALRELAAESIRGDELRSALLALVRRYRRALRFGRPAPAALAGLNLLISVMICDRGGEATAIVIELMEALADAGLSRLPSVWRNQAELPATAQVRLADVAVEATTWPRIEDLVELMAGVPVLVYLSQTARPDGSLKLLAAYLDPGHQSQLTEIRLGSRDVATIAKLANPDPAFSQDLTQAEIDSLLNNALPAEVINSLSDPSFETLVIVPSGDLWTVPWSSYKPMRRVRISLTQSIRLFGRTPKVTRPVRSIHAFIDESIPETEIVSDALRHARATTDMQITFGSTPSPDGDSDLVFVFAHGVGSGLNFSFLLEDGPVTAVDFATSNRSERVIVVACSSAATPSIAANFNLPAALMLNGVSQVVGGLWALPAAPMATMVADMVARIADGQTVTDALQAARQGAEGQLAPTEQWGLASYGRPDDEWDNQS